MSEAKKKKEKNCSSIYDPGPTFTNIHCGKPRGTNGKGSRCRKCYNEYMQYITKNPDVMKERKKKKEMKKKEDLTNKKEKNCSSRDFDPGPIFTNFHCGRNYTDGHGSRCRKCCNEYQQYMRSNPDAVAARKKNFEDSIKPNNCSSFPDPGPIFTNFHCGSDYTDGHGSRCRKCYNEYNNNKYENDKEYREYRMKYAIEWQKNKYENDKEWVEKRKERMAEKRIKELMELGYSEEEAKEQSSANPYAGYNEKFIKKHIWEQVYDKYNYQPLDCIVHYRDNNNKRRHFRIDKLGLLREEIEWNEDDEYQHDSYPVIADLCRECIGMDELLKYYDAAKLNRLNSHYKGFFDPMDALAKKLRSKFTDDHHLVLQLEEKMVQSDTFNSIYKTFESEVKMHSNKPIRHGWEKHYLGYSKNKVVEIKCEKQNRKDLFADIDIEYAYVIDDSDTKKDNDESDIDIKYDFYHWKCNWNKSTQNK